MFRQASEESPDLALHHRLRDIPELRRVPLLQLGKIPLYRSRRVAELESACAVFESMYLAAAFTAPNGVSGKSL